MTQMIRAGVFGASGYAGMDLVELLNRHPNVDLIFATSNSYAGEFVPNADLRYIPVEEAVFDGIDVALLALPHTASAPIAKQVRDAGIKVIDLSADFRLDTPDTYKTWYGVDHPHPEMLPAQYGLPEIYREQIRSADLIAVPGCYPTATLLGLYPLLPLDSVSLDSPIIIDAKSGVSGAGRKPSLKTHFVEVFGNLTPYNTGHRHRHVGEIEQIINRMMNLKEGIIFTPHLVPTARGLMASIYVTLNYNMTSDRVHSLYVNVYADEPLVHVLPLGTDASFRNAVLTNHCAISVTPVTERYLLITSVIDNLRKGASSQAVQCMNLMFDLPETTGLV